MSELLKFKTQFFDKNGTRYRLVKTNPGKFNWLFFPGGPGADSTYFMDLIALLDLPGNFWLIDFPENGSNRYSNERYDFEHWTVCFLDAMLEFESIIYVGHSFSGMFALLFKDLEDILEGLIILNSAPCLWHEEAQKIARENDIPPFGEPIEDFRNNPNPETFKTALVSCTPYYFHTNFINEGSKLLEQLTFNYFPASWRQNKAVEINYKAKWIPQKLPTLILGASHDFMTPFSLFEKDAEFHRENIKLKKIEDAGHFPWLEKGAEVKTAFELFFLNNLAKSIS